MRIKHPFLLFISFFLPGITQAQSIHSPLLKGDKAYDMEQYKTAEKHYRVAADRDMGNPQAVYNLANALYQQGNFEDAGERYLQVAKASKTPLETADALHNLGNSLLKQRKYKESVQAYQESLRLRPGDPETKMNLQMALKRLKEEQQKEKEKQQQNQAPQQGQPNQPQDQNQDQKPQNQPDPKRNQPNPPQENQQGQQPQPPNEQQKKQSEQKLKKEEAKRLLETAIGPDDRKNAQKYRAAQQQSKPKGTKKDW